MHLLLDMLPASMPLDGAQALDPELRTRAVRMFTLYTSDRPSLARAALKAAQVCGLNWNIWPLSERHLLEYHLNIMKGPIIW